MGNSHSNGSPSNPQSPTTARPPHHSRGGADSRRTTPSEGVGQGARQGRRESIAVGALALSHAAGKPTPPATTLVHHSTGEFSRASPHTFPSSHSQQGQSSATQGSHSRARSVGGQGGGIAATSQPFNEPLSKQPSSQMGNEQSRETPRRPSRSKTLPQDATLPTPATTHAAPETQPEASPSAHPLEVPQQTAQQFQTRSFAPSAPPPSDSPYQYAPGNYNKPPRLPLPIEQEVHTPGSPIISPHDFNTPLDHDEVDGALPRRTSVLSSTTADDDDGGDADFPVDPAQSLAPHVPTVLEWKGVGDKVYVTGTFVQWERKFKLHRDKDRNRFSATLPLRPGTHHLKFLVDGDMQTSNDLPTTVDYTNILVNYIEVIAPLPKEAGKPAPAVPMPIPGAALTAGQATGTSEPAARPLDIRTKAHAPETEADLPSTLEDVAAGKRAHHQVPGQQQQAQQQSIRSPISSPSPRTRASQTPQQSTGPKPSTPKPKPQAPRPKYTSEIPSFLADLDRYSIPNDPAFSRASKVINALPQPPSLPMFLSKSILNGATPHKDDASVLIMPNHTVLNHLATSSIKNGVLATSGTTRYKRKFLTTIMYKPTSEDG
ncbi:hypothetical protein MBLNU230_g2138t1 [Neophaeotheca triangularis]